MEQLSLFEYEDIKNKIKTKLNETVNNFVVIGFYLKQVRDNMLYTQDGYKNMEEFARGEYNLSASTASRFMDINTRFSEGGNSQVLKMEYANFGYSKLQEMLTVKDEDLELITEDTTVKQIRELKALEKQEEKAAEQETQNSLPIVQMVKLDQTEEVVTSQENPFIEVMVEYWKNRVEILKKVHNNMITPEDLAEELCPSGSKTFNHGIYMIFFYDINGGIKVRYYKDRAAQVEPYTYSEWIEKTNEIISNEIYDKLTNPVMKEEQKKEAVEVPKKEWQEPEAVVKEKEPDKVPIPQVVERKEEETEYKPLPGQVTTDDIPELNDTVEKPAAVVEEEKEQGIIDADYRELDNEDELPSIDQLNKSISYIKAEINVAEKIIERKKSEGVNINPHIEQLERLNIVMRAIRYCIRQQEA